MSNITKPVTLKHSNHIYPLTSLRFFAAALVYILHASNHGLVTLKLLQYIDLSKAVSFFFLLSGFVLSYAYSERRVFLFKFYASRFLRIWPVTFLSLFVTIIFLPNYIYLPSPSSQFSSGLVLLTNILCVQSLIPIPSFYFGFNAVSWSVSVELIFYALFPFLINLNLRALTYTLFLNVLFIGIVLGFSGSLRFYATDAPLAYDQIMLHGLFYINPISRLPEFILGILTCKFFQCNYIAIFRTKINSISYSIPSLEILTRCIGTFLCLLFFLAALSSYLPFDIPYDSIKLIMSQFKSAIFFSLFILLLLICPSHLTSFLSARVLIVLGEISFSFYLFHQFLLIKSSQLGGIVVLGLQIMPPNFFIIFVWSLLISFVSYFLFEKPIKYYFSQKSFLFIGS